MTTWLSKLDIKQEWQASKAGNMSLQDLSRIVAAKLRALPAYPGDDMLLDLTYEFDALAQNQELTADDFDFVWGILYDWADTPVIPGWPHTRRCWIATF